MHTSADAAMRISNHMPKPLFVHMSTHPPAHVTLHMSVPMPQRMRCVWPACVLLHVRCSRPCVVLCRRLYNNKLSGEIPKELGNLSSLIAL